MTRVPGDLLCCARSLGLHRGGVGVKPHISAQVGYDGCTSPQPNLSTISDTYNPTQTVGLSAFRSTSTPHQHDTRKTAPARIITQSQAAAGNAQLRTSFLPAIIGPWFQPVN